MSLQLARPAINHLHLSRQLPRYREESEDIGRPRTEDMALRIQVYLSQVGPSYYLCSIWLSMLTLFLPSNRFGLGVY
jgi:hypothetical protein